MKKKMTKSELAKKAGVSIAFFTDLTNDKANPRSESSKRLPRHLKRHADAARQFRYGAPILKCSPNANLANYRKALSGRRRVEEYEAYQVDQWDKKNRAF